MTRALIASGWVSLGVVVMFAIVIAFQHTLRIWLIYWFLPIPNSF